MGRLLQSPYTRAEWACVIWVLALLYSFVLLVADGPHSEEVLVTRYTAGVAVVYWAMASFLLLGLRPSGWRSPNDLRREAAVLWLLGFLAMAWHIAAAFHLLHHWSHAAAFEHTERTAGLGEGIFVNYLFVLLWGADALWLLLRPEHYARRPRWVGWAVHGFLTFVTFNATVVYGAGVARWLGVVAFTTLAVQWVRTHQRSRPEPT